MRSLSFKIRGMDCAEEVASLQTALGPLVEGEANLAFNLLNGTMTVRMPEGISNEEAIRQAVSRMGMEAIPWREAHAAPLGEETFWQRHGRTMLCLVSALCLLGGFLWHALHHKTLLDALATGDGSGAHLFPLVSILLYLGSVISGAWFIVPKALYAARAYRPDMNLLMMVAVAGAIVIGEWFEAAAVTFLFALALILESWSVGRARRAIKALMHLAPTTARCLSPENAVVSEHAVEEVPVGSTVLVRPGEKIPLDGVVLTGTTAVNQAPITGESIPLPKSLGDEVFAGTINGDGAFTFRTTRLATDTTLARIIHLVEEAHTRRAPSEQWVAKFTRVYTPAMMLVAVLIATVPPLLFGGAWSVWGYQALVILVIACPCALVISTPVSIVAGVTAAAKAGVLIKGGAFLEAPARVQVIAFDKTGTLTHGHPVVQEVIPLNGHTERELLACAAALEAQSTHPLARAILDKAASLGLTYTPAVDLTVLQGKGAEATIDGTHFWIGSHRLIEELGVENAAFHEMATRLEDAGHSLVALSNSQHICGLISVADSIRPEAPEVVRALKRLGMAQVVMLSGDNQGTAQAVAAATGVDQCWAELLPEDKVRLVEELGQRFGPVAIVGDGVNDTPAMAVAAVGIAMGAIGSDAAIETADIALMSDDLLKLPWLIQHARRTLAVIKQNILFALGTKLLFMGLAVAGVATLWMAIAADMGASLLVICNGLRLLHGTSPRGTAGAGYLRQGQSP
ncbi:MAG: heavy metal translocating P-type ATPase [Candidatus Tectimicrobiota bacterium]